MKKLIIVLLTFILVGCAEAPTTVIDDNCDNSQGCEIAVPADINEVTLDFKESYEILNGEKNAKGVDYRVVDIADNDIFKLVDIEKIEDYEEFADLFTGIVLVSDPKCPWCRSVISTAVDTAKELGVKDVYVIHAWDAEGKELFRDKYVWSGDSLKLEEGHPLYNMLIGMPGNEVLDDYTIKNSEGENIILGEKRIYLPSFIYVNKGKIEAFTTGISKLQTEANMELTDEIKAEMKTKLTEFFKKTQ